MNEAREAVTQVLDLNEKKMRHTRDTMIRLAIIVLGTILATHASATGRGGFHTYPPPAGFLGLVITVPAMQQPVFNPSVPYTVPKVISVSLERGHG